MNARGMQTHQFHAPSKFPLQDIFHMLKPIFSPKTKGNEIKQPCGCKSAA